MDQVIGYSNPIREWGQDVQCRFREESVMLTNKWLSPCTTNSGLGLPMAKNPEELQDHNDQLPTCWKWHGMMNWQPLLRDGQISASLATIRPEMWTGSRLDKTYTNQAPAVTDLSTGGEEFKRGMMRLKISVQMLSADTRKLKMPKKWE